VTGTPRPCYRSISIVADGRLEVCDGAHWAFVMKKGRGRTRELRSRLELRLDTCACSDAGRIGLKTCARCGFNFLLAAHDGYN
jgi:hypothetical protein